MQVDNTNFQQFLPQILIRIHQADFVAFDCEFTGLVAQLQRIEGLFSNYVQFYERIKETALNFRIVQLGIAAFVFQNGQYKPYVYNFYVSPSTWSKGYNNIMVCEVESLEFLIKNKLDFSKVFSNGIKSRRLLSNDEKQKHKYNDTPTFDSDNFFFSPQEEEKVSQIEEKVIKQIMNDPKAEKLVDFSNRALFNYFRRKYPDLLLDKSKKNMKQFQYILRFREKQGNQKQMNEKNIGINKNIDGADKKTEEDIVFQNEQEGLEKIFEALINGKKPLVGHFPNLDIGLIYHSFIADIPQSYEQFCANLNNIFPYIFDTKILSRRLQSRIKGIKVDLPSLFKACSSPKLLKPYANLDLSGLQQYIGKQHEAGYDAFITGCSFVGMANYLGGEVGHINFQAIENENKIFYSRFSGQVSLSGNGYTSNALLYDQKILIQPLSKDENPDWRKTAQLLSKFGSLSVHEDRGETYYVFEEQQKLPVIVEQLSNIMFKKYSERKIIGAKNMYPKFV